MATNRQSKLPIVSDPCKSVISYYAESRFYEVRTLAYSTVMYIFCCFMQPCVDTGAGRRKARAPTANE